MVKIDPSAQGLRKINSMTKYPSIPTYHKINPSNGKLGDPCIEFPGRVIGTEKIDGTSGRVILLPNGRWIIGSREELLTYEGDTIANPALGIVEALRPLATSEPMRDIEINDFWVFYVEVYGHNATPAKAWKQYGDGKTAAYRLFDVAHYDQWDRIMGWPIEEIASWRQGGGQPFHGEDNLVATAEALGIPLVPRLFDLPDRRPLPVSVGGMGELLEDGRYARSGAMISEHGVGNSEGIVLRSADRQVIAKARIADYRHTARLTASGR